MTPRNGAPGSDGTGTIDFPSKLATPSSVPIQRTPSVLCARAATDDCGNPRQLDLLNVRNDRVGVHSFVAASNATGTNEIARMILRANAKHTRFPADTSLVMVKL